MEHLDRDQAEAQDQAHATDPGQATDAGQAQEPVKDAAARWCIANAPLSKTDATTETETLIQDQTQTKPAAESTISPKARTKTQNLTET